MKVGILTWYKALNHGAVLQAYATQNVLRGLGFECGMLDFNRVITRQKTIKYLKKKLWLLLHWGFSQQKNIKIFESEKEHIFKLFIENKINVLGDYKKTAVDVALIGSDMVFSLDQGYNSYMFGKGVIANKIISYAASSGGSKIELARKYGVENEISDLLNKLGAIGCRDFETEKFVMEISGRSDTQRNIDPVLLYGFQNEIMIWNTNKWRKHEPYLLIYSYTGNMNTKKEIKEIRTFADKHKLCVISCGYYHPWCDENINATPEEFLEIVYESQCVVTDTFHGTVFSLITRKPFTAIIRGNGFKLESLLRDCHMTSRIATDPNQIIEVMENTIDYSFFESWYNSNRNSSLKFLLDNLQF